MDMLGFPPSLGTHSYTEVISAKFLLFVMQLQRRNCEFKPAMRVFTSVLGSALHSGLVEKKSVPQRKSGGLNHHLM